MQTLKFYISLKNGRNYFKSLCRLNFINSNSVCKFQLILTILKEIILSNVKSQENYRIHIYLDN